MGALPTPAQRRTVALQDHHAIKVLPEGSCRGEAGQASANHDGSAGSGRGGRAGGGCGGRAGGDGKAGAPPHGAAAATGGGGGGREGWSQCGGAAASSISSRGCCGRAANCSTRHKHCLGLAACGPRKRRPLHRCWAACRARAGQPVAVEKRSARFRQPHIFGGAAAPRWRARHSFASCGLKPWAAQPLTRFPCTHGVHDARRLFPAAHRRSARPGAPRRPPPPRAPAAPAVQPRQARWRPGARRPDLGCAWGACRRRRCCQPPAHLWCRRLPPSTCLPACLSHPAAAGTQARSLR